MLQRRSKTTICGVKVVRYSTFWLNGNLTSILNDRTNFSWKYFWGKTTTMCSLNFQVDINQKRIARSILDWCISLLCSVNHNLFTVVKPSWIVRKLKRLPGLRWESCSLLVALLVLQRHVTSHCVKILYADNYWIICSKAIIDTHRQGALLPSPRVFCGEWKSNQFVESCVTSYFTQP